MVYVFVYPNLMWAPYFSKDNTKTYSMTVKTTDCIEQLIMLL